MPDLTSTEDAESMSRVSEAVRLTVDVQRSGIERLETKATILLGFVATAVPLYAAQSDAQAVFRALAFVVYAISAMAGLAASKPYKSEESPPVRDFVARFVAEPQPPASVSRWTAASLVVAFEKNRKTNERKAGYTWIALYSFALAAVLSVASLAL